VKISENLTEQLIRMGRQWIIRQRNQHAPRGSPLPGKALESLAPFFFTDTLESVRIVQVATIENPAFYGTMLTSRIPRLIDFRKASGITFIDTILLSDGVIGGSPPLSLLFHEIVHVVQYRLLGVDEFARRYVLGWMKNGYRYEAIPLEKQAFGLTARFIEEKRDFSVDLEVERTMPS
jgi:hypothetical protein